MKSDTARLTINIPVTLLNELDEYSTKMNINRTSSICVLLSQSLNNQKAMGDIGKLIKIYQEQIENEK